MVASSPQDEIQFLIFFYAAVAQNESKAQQALYAIDFGVKKSNNVSHLQTFDAISMAYQAIVNTVKTRQSSQTNPDSFRVLLIDSMSTFFALQKQEQPEIKFGAAQATTDS